MSTQYKPGDITVTNNTIRFYNTSGKGYFRILARSEGSFISDYVSEGYWQVSDREPVVCTIEDLFKALQSMVKK